MVRPQEKQKQVSSDPVRENMSRIRSRGPGSPSLDPGGDSGSARGLRGHLLELEPQRAYPRPAWRDLKGQISRAHSHSRELCCYGVAASGSSEFSITGAFQASDRYQPL